MDIFRVAVRGAQTIGDLEVQPVAASLPGVRFFQQPHLVALRITADDRELRGAPTILARGNPATISPGADQILIGDTWLPIETETSLAVADWLERNSDEGRLNIASYASLYGARDRPFELLDEVSDEDLARLNAAEPQDGYGLNATLYAYQETGIRWLRARADHALGGILGDEMGLGKTIQLIGLLVDRIRRGAQPHLVVMPLTLLENWRREFIKFAPHVRVYRHQGQDRTRRPSILGEQQVVITTYDVAVLDEPVLSLVHWDTVIADEAQAIKNPDARRSIAIKGLPRRVSFASTGTPLENRTMDMWSLTDFAVPGYLGTRGDFEARLQESPADLRNVVRPLLLRREVAAVASDLPDRLIVDVPLEMFGPEAAGYDQVRRGIIGQMSTTSPLALITRLRQYTAHPDILEGRRPTPTNRSAKLTRLVEVAGEIVDEGAKGLVFVNFLEAADTIRDALTSQFSTPVWTIDGRTPISNRQGTIDTFGDVEGSAFLVLNPAAAGVGLNIQAATHVIHYTLEWNPAKEAQATARAWRRGQTRPVTVHRFYYVNTIDEAINERLQYKKDLFGEVVTPTMDGDLSLKRLLERAVGFGDLSGGVENES